MFKRASGTTKAVGDAAEGFALGWLQARGLVLVERNYRLARGPAARGGEVDLILREADGTLVFVEVRTRRNATRGGAAASIGVTKQRRIVFAAQHYLRRFATPPPCRFDVLALEGEPGQERIEWLQAAFDAA